MSTNFDKIVRSWMNNEKMSGYIKKSALAEELLNLAIAGKDKIKISSVINMIEGLPAADVAPVVHTTTSGEYWDEAYCKWKVCGNCHGDNVSAAKYCNWCGARLDGEHHG